MKNRIHEISSLSDPRVDVYRDVRDADLRGRDKLFMAESELVVRRLLRTPERLHSLFLSPNKIDRLESAIVDAGGTFPIYVAPVDLMSEIAGFLIHRGALAAGFRPDPDALRPNRVLAPLREREAYSLLLAEGITNVDNMGGLFRNAAAFAVDAVMLDSTCCDPLYRKAIRVSVGHTLSVPYAVSQDWRADLALLHEWGVTIVGAECVADALPLWRLPRAKSLAIVVGSEATGLRPETLSACDAVVQIPMPEGVPSLNVATASGVLLYERLRSMHAESELDELKA